MRDPSTLHVTCPPSRTNRWCFACRPHLDGIVEVCDEILRWWQSVPGRGGDGWGLGRPMQSPSRRHQRRDAEWGRNDVSDVAPLFAVRPPAAFSNVRASPWARLSYGICSAILALDSAPGQFKRPSNADRLSELSRNIGQREMKKAPEDVSGAF
jgi:hypothetical protein